MASPPTSEFSPNMKGDFDRVEQVFQVALTIRDRGDMDGVRGLFAFWVVEGRLTRMQQDQLNRQLKEQDMPEIIELWRQEGIEIGIERGTRRKGLDAARKMREHGIAWDIVTDVTGIRPEDLEHEESR